MPNESIYPEYIEPIADNPVTTEEKLEIAKAIIKGWNDGDIVKDTSRHFRIKYGVSKAKNILVARKKEIGAALFKVQHIDDMLYREKRQLIHEINTLMTTWPQPATKNALNTALQGDYHLSKTLFFAKFSDHRCQKLGSTWAEFVGTYPTPVEPSPEPIIEEP